MIPFHRFADIFPLIEGAEFEAMVADVRAHGLRELVVILDGQVLDGRNRTRAAEKAGIFVGDGVNSRQFSPEDEGDPLAFVISKNVHRRHLTESQRAMAAARIEQFRHGGGRKQLVDARAEPGHDEQKRDVPRPKPQDANLHLDRKAAAGMLNVSTRTVAHAAVVRDQAEPELRQAVEQGHLAVSAAAKAVVMAPAQQRSIAEAATAGKSNVVNAEIKKAARTVREAELGAKITALPTEQFGVVLEDPEWDTIVWSRDTGMDRHQANQYPVSSDEALAAREVASIMAPNCVHLVWCKDLMQGLRLIEARGTVLKSYIVWVKDIVEIELTPEQRRAGNDADRHFIAIGAAGTGFWVRDRDELLLIAVKGSPVCPAPGTQGDSTVFAARPRDAKGKIIHSAKPECILEWVERHWPSTPKIELNARRARAGWAQWGNEAPDSAATTEPTEAESSPAEPQITPLQDREVEPSSTQIAGMPGRDKIAEALAGVRRMVS